MRFIAGLALMLCACTSGTVAQAAYCSAGRCFVNCMYQSACGCIYDHEEDECLCWCEGKPLPGRTLTLDLKGTTWETLRQQKTVMDVLNRILRKDVIQCVSRMRGGLTVGLTSASPGQVSAAFGEVCRR